MSIIRRRRWGPCIGQEWCLGPAGDHPPSPPSCLRRLSERYALGQNQESRSRPGNCDCRPRNAISQELTSLVSSIPLGGYQIESVTGLDNLADGKHDHASDCHCNSNKAFFAISDVKLSILMCSIEVLQCQRKIMKLTRKTAIDQ